MNACQTRAGFMGKADEVQVEADSCDHNLEAASEAKFTA
eukprot:CAMPEP_0184751326 /NCGR_PEP_ID=MMETSP0315-20130426/42049_1 /TAXON_ID=101924 /ORGANISM="Rhodosorus marinus, Strain UTEX LB 2760" /LENGTH=38 /DNA_ID= /DNA_START= /DNA_END= /DNA_ORIENTATION=